MRYLRLREVLELHRMLVEQSGGAITIRDVGALQAAIAQPRVTFGGEDLYPTIEEKAAALAFSLISNHPFMDGNKRIGHAAMETFLILNGYELRADVDEAEAVILGVAAGKIDRPEFLEWVRRSVVPLEPR